MDDIRSAYLADELDRYQREHSGLFAFANSNRPVYGIVPDPDPTMADIDDDAVETRSRSWPPNAESGSANWASGC